MLLPSFHVTLSWVPRLEILPEGRQEEKEVDLYPETVTSLSPFPDPSLALPGTQCSLSYGVGQP